MAWFEDFDLHKRIINGRPVRFRTTAEALWRAHPQRPVLVLLHGFPQTHVLWHRVAQRLRDHFRLVMPDLRGYGESSCEPGEPDHGNYSKRAMAEEIVNLVDSLGVGKFSCAATTGAAGWRIASRSTTPIVFSGSACSISLPRSTCTRAPASSLPRPTTTGFI